MKKYKDYDRLEIRSEKLRKLLGEKPSLIVRWGSVVIFILFMSILIAVGRLPYPHGAGESILEHFLR